MPLFIILTEELGNKIRINPKYIVTIHGHKECSWITVVDKYRITVKETPEQIEKLIHDGYYNDDW